jgi:tetratricopeptide (TPR) repeat protein
MRLQIRRVRETHQPQQKTVRFTHPTAVILAVALAAALCGFAGAKEQPLRFVHALQDAGYGDMAVEYLKLLEQQPDLPPEIRAVWDLEMAKSLKAAAAAAFDAKESETLMAESQQYLAKFIKNSPNHPDAVMATTSWGDFLVKRALESLRVAKTEAGRDKEQADKHLSEARASLGEARDKFQQAEKKFRSQLAELPPPSKLPTKRAERVEVTEARQRVEASLYEAQFQIALIDYYLAQTYSAPAGAQRSELLKKAAQALDDIYQQNRENRIGLYAHMWHGKAAEELGDLQTAEDIYDEVLARAPEPSDKGPATGLEPLFAQVEHFRLMILAKKKPQQFLPEARAWLQDYQRLKQTEGYQGVLLDYAKAVLAQAEDMTAPKKAKAFAEVLQMVTEGAKVRSPVQQELFVLRREILKTSGRDIEANTFDEAVALGDAAVAGLDWQKALSAYNKAIGIADRTKLKNPGAIAAVREAMGRVQVMIARDLFAKGQFTECIETAGKVVRDEEGNVKRESAAAAQASALGVAAALNLYASAAADKKPAAMERLTKLAEFTEKNWPDRPEADDARMARGQAKLVVGQVPEAIAIFDRVNPKSERYATAMYWAGQNYWRLYVAEKMKPEGTADKNQMAANRAKAQERLATAVETLQKQKEPGQPMPRAMVQSQLLMAEMHNEAGEFKEAAALYQPLVDAVKAEQPKNLDSDTIRIFLGAVRAYCALSDLDKAGQVSAVLIELGPDTLQTNEVLVEFAKVLNLERKKADAHVTELENSAGGELTTAKARLASTQELLSKTLSRLSQRQELGLGQAMFIGETLNSLGKTTEASQQFQKLLKRTETDPDFAKRAQKAMSLLRTELLKALRNQERYDEALKQVDQLIKENPRALEPLMEKGRILEGWAEKDPTKFEQAVAHWAMLRTRLQAMKKKPDEYYDVMYNVAKCLVRETEKSDDKALILDRAKKAEQVLKAALILSPRLNGPDAVARYKVLLNKAIAIQGRSPEIKAEKKDVKTP